MGKVKRYTKEEKRQILDKYLSSGLDIQKFAKNNGMSNKTIYRWIEDEKQAKVPSSIRTNIETNISKVGERFKALRRLHTGAGKPRYSTKTFDSLEEARTFRDQSSAKITNRQYKRSNNISPTMTTINIQETNPAPTQSDKMFLVVGSSTEITNMLKNFGVL